MRILFASTRGGGHLQPLLPLARACAAAGHEVLVAAPAVAGGQARRAGLPFAPVAEPPAAAVRAAWAPVWSSEGAPGAAYVIAELFVGFQARAALPDMLRVVDVFGPDVVVRETLEFTSALAAERAGVPVVRFGIHLASESDHDPGLLGLAAPAVDALRGAAGLEPDPDATAIAAEPLLTFSPRSMDAVPAAPVLRFRTPAPAAAAAPELIYVTFGSEAAASGHFPGVYRDTAEALAPLGLPVLMSVGEAGDPAELGPLPRAVRAERWVDPADVLPRAAAVVSHGGSGTTLATLAVGVPQAFRPLFVDGPRNAERVARAGAGIVAGDDVAAAVRALLADGAYRAGAERIRDEIAALAPISDAVDVLDGVAGARA